MFFDLEDLGSMYSKAKLFLIATFYSSHRNVYLPVVKFIYSEKTTTIWHNFTHDFEVTKYILNLLSNLKTIRKLFMAFSENLNFR